MTTVTKPQAGHQGQPHAPNESRIKEHQSLRFMRLVVIAMAAAMVVACAGGPHRTTGTGPATVQTPVPSLPPVVSAPATMLPGNIVPFVNEPAAASEFQATLPAQPQPRRPSGPSCTSSQLAGTLPRWVRKSHDNDGERMDPVQAASLYGWVVVTNTSDKPCTLQGKVGARLVDAAGELRVDYSNDINATAQKAVTGGNAAKATVLPTSPLSVLTTSIVSHPTTGSPGKAIRYVVALYEVVLTIPATLKPGLTMQIHWLLRAPWLASDVDPTNGFSITIK